MKSDEESRVHLPAIHVWTHVCVRACAHMVAACLVGCGAAGKVGWWKQVTG